MNQEKKNDFPWETMDVTTLMLPEELIAYHLYCLKLSNGVKKEKRGVGNDMNLLSSYLAREQIQKEEKSKCFQK